MSATPRATQRYYHCNICNKVFTAKRLCQQHQTACKVAHDAVKEVNARQDPSINPTPFAAAPDAINVKSMYAMLVVALTRIEALEKQVKSLRQSEHVPRVNILQWLQVNRAPDGVGNTTTLALRQFLRTLAHTTTMDIEYLFQHTFPATVAHILDRNIGHYFVAASSPIFVYGATIYTVLPPIPRSGQPIPQPKWGDHTSDVLRVIAEYLSEALLSALVQWRIANPGKSSFVRPDAAMSADDDADDGTIDYPVLYTQTSRTLASTEAVDLVRHIRPIVLAKMRTSMDGLG